MNQQPVEDNSNFQSITSAKNLSLIFAISSQKRDVFLFYGNGEFLTVNCPSNTINEIQEKSDSLKLNLEKTI